MGLVVADTKEEPRPLGIVSVYGSKHSKWLPIPKEAISLLNIKVGSTFRLRAESEPAPGMVLTLSPPNSSVVQLLRRGGRTAESISYAITIPQAVTKNIAIGDSGKFRLISEGPQLIGQPTEGNPISVKPFRGQGKDDILMRIILPKKVKDALRLEGGDGFSIKILDGPRIKYTTASSPADSDAVTKVSEFKLPYGKSSVQSYVMDVTIPESARQKLGFSKGESLDLEMTKGGFYLSIPPKNSYGIAISSQNTVKPAYANRHIIIPYKAIKAMGWGKERSLQITMLYGGGFRLGAIQSAATPITIYNLTNPSWGIPSSIRDALRCRKNVRFTVHLSGDEIIYTKRR
ncbi:MAG TPA: hypothetical protein VMV00_00405 [Candidatus Baltobacteraceae bacterium]|nr:hypothetical protein [Candidatus Baltobacteraceae bacterium]